MSTEKLDSFSKILIATGQINYMAACINNVNEQLKMSGLAKQKIHGVGVRQRDKNLKVVVKKLSAIMEYLGDVINGHDCICEIDERVSKVPFEILIHGMDETETCYPDNDENINP